MTENKLLETLGQVDLSKIPEPRDKRLDKILSTLDEVSDDLSDNEQEFVYDMTVRFGQNANITEKQFAWLERIYERYGD